MVSSFMNQGLLDCHTEIQDEIFPLVLGDWLNKQSEYMQVLAGEAFLTLLKADRFSV